MTRDRSQTFFQSGGTAGRFTDTPDLGDGADFISGIDSCSDWQGLRGDFFTADHSSWGGGVINREWDSYFSPYFNNYTCDAVRSHFVGSTHLFTDSPSGSEVATKVHVATSPSRPYVDVAEAVGELKDFPSLFKIAGTNLLDIRKAGKFGKPQLEQLRQTHHTPIEGVAEAHLNNVFGWAPMISDFLKVMQFGGQVDRRVSELQSLMKKGGLRKTVHIGEYKAEQHDILFAQSVYRFLPVNLWTRTTEKVWGFINWFPEADFPASSHDMRRAATKAVLGLTVDASTAWELVPFSWLADWCSNIGSFLQACRNIIPASHGPVQVYRHFETEFLGSSYTDSSDGLSMGPIYCTKNTKTRRLALPSITAHFPFLNQRRMSILGAVGVLNGDRRFKGI